MSKLLEVVFSNKFGRDVTNFDLHIFWAVKQCAEVEIGDIEGGKACISGGEDIVELEFNQFKQASSGASISRVTDAVSANGNTRTVRVLLLRSHLTNNP